MPFSLVLSASSPADALRAALIDSLHAAHRPELADVVASAALAVDLPGVWLRLPDASLSATWLERKLFEAAVEAGVPLSWIRILAGAGQGSEPTKNRNGAEE